MQPQRQPQRQWAYLSNAAEEMRWLSMSADPNRESMVKAAQLGCQTMQQLEHDQDFYECIEVLGSRSREYRDAVKEITQDLEHLRFFLRVEREVMLKGGMSQPLVDTLMQKTEELLNLLAQWQFDVERLRGGLQSIRYQACRLGDSLERAAREEAAAQASKEAAAKKFRQQLMYVVYTAGGAAIVMLNNSPLATEMGLTIPGTAVSGAIGSALIGAAIPAPGRWQ